MEISSPPFHYNSSATTMATTDHSAEIQANLTRDLLARLKKQLSDMSPDEFEEFLVESGSFQADRVYEIVTSLETGIPLNSIEGCDLEDNSNCKMCAGWGPVNGQKTAHGWKIKVDNCIGDVRAILWQPISKRIFEAHIPFSMIRNIDNLTITEGKKGGFGKFTKYVKEIEPSVQFA